jgi:hypothetical protein
LFNYQSHGAPLSLAENLQTRLLNIISGMGKKIPIPQMTPTQLFRRLGAKAGQVIDGRFLEKVIPPGKRKGESTIWRLETVAGTPEAGSHNSPARCQDPL